MKASKGGSEPNSDKPKSVKSRSKYTYETVSAMIMKLFSDVKTLGFQVTLIKNFTMVVYKEYYESILYVCDNSSVPPPVSEFIEVTTRIIHLLRLTLYQSQKYMYGDLCKEDKNYGHLYKDIQEDRDFHHHAIKTIAPSFDGIQYLLAGRPMKLNGKVYNAHFELIFAN